MGLIAVRLGTRDNRAGPPAGVSAGTPRRPLGGEGSPWAEDLVVGNGSASELQGNNATYTVTITPEASGTVTVDIAAGAAQDSAGNPSAAAAQFSITADLTPVPALPLAGAIVLALLLLRGARQRAART